MKIDKEPIDNQIKLIMSLFKEIGYKPNIKVSSSIYESDLVINLEIDYICTLNSSKIIVNGLRNNKWRFSFEGRSNMKKFFSNKREYKSLIECIIDVCLIIQKDNLFEISAIWKIKS